MTNIVLNNYKENPAFNEIPEKYVECLLECSHPLAVAESIGVVWQESHYEPETGDSYGMYALIDDDYKIALFDTLDEARKAKYNLIHILKEKMK